MFRRSGLLSVATACLLSTDPALAYEFGDFELTGGGSGGVTVRDPSGTYTLSFTLTGNDNGSSGIVTRFQSAARAFTTVDFEWSYTTTDSGGPSWDPAGYSVGGLDAQLSNDGGPLRQRGREEFTVDEGEVFGWYVRSVDGIAGAASLTVEASFVVLAATAPAFSFGDIVQIEPESRSVSLPSETLAGVVVSEVGESAGFKAVGADATVRIRTSDLEAGLGIQFGDREAFLLDVAGVDPGIHRISSPPAFSARFSRKRSTPATS